jgi:hypothetical protein
MATPAKHIGHDAEARERLQHYLDLPPDQLQVARANMSPAERKEMARLWAEENAEAIRSSNEWVERIGLPLAKYRPF